MTATITDFNNLAVAQIGVPYVFGGINLRGTASPGVDCSGLPFAVSAALGEAIPRTSEAQYAGLPAVAEANLRRGDLVLLDVPGDDQPQPAHVVIWWNASTVLQAPHTGEDVMFSPTLPYAVMGYRRLPFPDAGPPVVVPQMIFKPLSGRYGVLNQPVVAIVRRPQNDGYWEVAADGGTFAYGKAPFVGSLASIKLNQPIVDAASTPSGNGLTLVATDGGIFDLGDSKFEGSMGGKPLNAPVVSIEVTASGNGYWCAAADGGIFAFGDAAFLGSAA